jgi:peptidoglycan/LPS O-acetylase OafA/YrhL
MLIGYRKDIDGLRAIAVLPVVLYHAGASGFGGGFIGVDVFFVISGYLITAILADEIRRGEFSVLGFYERRARRIFPALFVMLLLSIVAFTTILLPFDLRAFSRSVMATVSFTSNILFHLESGYFAAPSELKPLLHTWSLAVEEQFYIVFPILLYLLSRTGRRTRNAALVAIVALSFAVNLWGVRPHPSATFYLLPARGWELLLGSLLALDILPVPAGRGLREIVAALGLALIGTGVLTLSAADPFPGWNAALPCLGAALVIWAGTGGETFGGRLLGLGPVVFIGKISYSLYLWHWPIIVFVKYSTDRPLSPAETGMVIAASLVAAILSWRFVEQPFRGKGRFTRRGVFTASAVATGLLLSVGAVGYGTKGWPRRFPEAIPIIAKYADYPPSFGMLRRGTCFLQDGQQPAEYDRDTCYGGASPDALIWGDSLAAHLYRGLSIQASRAKLTIGQATLSLCAPILNLPAYYTAGCKDFNDHILGLIRQDPPKTVILAGRWEVVGLDGVARLGDTIAALKAAGSQVIVVGQSPIFAAPAYAMYIKALHNDTVGSPVAENDYGPLNQRVAEVAAQSGAAFFAPEQLFCSGGLCRIQQDGALLFWDNSHLTEEGSDYVGEKFFVQFGAVLTARAQTRL